MTKFTDKTKEKKVKKKVETTFQKIIDDDLILEDARATPKNWDNVDLIRIRDNRYPFDLMVAYDDGNEGINEIWYLGQAGSEFDEVEE